MDTKHPFCLSCQQFKFLLFLLSLVHERLLLIFLKVREGQILVKLPESILKASAKAADDLKVIYAPTNINVEINVTLAPGQENNVASIVSEALKPYVDYLRASSTENVSAMLEMATATAALTVKKSTGGE